MRIIIGCTLCIVGIALGLYCGIWWGVIGGIIQVIDQVRAEHLVASEVAIGVARIVFAGLIGWLSAAIFFIPGVIMLKD